MLGALLRAFWWKTPALEWYQLTEEEKVEVMRQEAMRGSFPSTLLTGWRWRKTVIGTWDRVR